MTESSDSLDQLMDSGEAELPQFATVMRGYDRGQVDDYVARLNDFLADAEQRAQRAERGVADVTRRNERLTEELRQAIERRQQQHAGEPYAGLGERIEHILRLAGEEADSIREQARSEAEELLADAQRRRDTERENAERDLTAVAERRDAVVAELRKVQDALATLGLTQAVAAQIGEAAPISAISVAEDPAPGGPTGQTEAAESGRSESTEPSDPDVTRVIQLPTAARPS